MTEPLTLAQRLEVALSEWDSYDPFASNDKAMAQAMAVIDASRAMLPENASLRDANKALPAERDEARTMLADLASWFSDKPSEPEWRIKAGEYGADDAISAARSFPASKEASHAE